ncbi:hypothetical protein [Bradyrhizobium sp. LHD-71]|uniref:hypothetical protein n=1 Tax=Bradyrhizobium sp. LHD-71 TaxID=3072141 RepID=UPI0028109048|nr:hypothetical protein [Bradyrhizobium sp. LHD-71]MDQ8727034.1 hypothetical protein [Bradyrhizobium sp. LHD-71]
MNNYERLFLGLIFAGILMMVVGLGLMLSPARLTDSRLATAFKQVVDRAPTYLTRSGDSAREPLSIR